MISARGDLRQRVQRKLAAHRSVGGLRHALAPRSRRHRLTELDLSATETWESTGAVAATEVVPATEVHREAALAEVVLQPGVEGVPIDDPPSYLAPAGHLLRIRRGMVETSMCVPFRPKLGYVAHSIRKSPTIMKKRGYEPDLDSGGLVFPSRPKCLVTRPALLLALPFKDNYFHWLIESLGNLLLTSHLLPPDVLLAVRPGASAGFIRELLVEGVRDDGALFELPRRRVVTFPELYVPPSVVRSSANPSRHDRRLDFSPHPQAVLAVRRLAPSRSSGGKRLYVARETRKPSNEGEVVATLARYGFAKVTAENLSVREQMELFAQAEIVAGPHGAGLANIVFSSDATVIELQSSELEPGRRSLYWNLAAICDLRWVSVVCKAVEPDDRSDFYVDCGHLEQVLRRQVPAPR